MSNVRFQAIEIMGSTAAMGAQSGHTFASRPIATMGQNRPRSGAGA